jgi:hypothetical protein
MLLFCCCCCFFIRKFSACASKTNKLRAKRLNWTSFFCKNDVDTLLLVLRFIYEGKEKKSVMNIKEKVEALI